MLTISTMLAVAILIAIVFLALVLVVSLLIVGLKLGWAIGKTAQLARNRCLLRCCQPLQG